MNVGYKVEIRQKEPDMKSAVVVWSRYLDTMPSAMIAALQGVVAMHERLGYPDDRALGIDLDCARGWNPRTAPITIERGSFTLIAKGN